MAYIRVFKGTHRKWFARNPDAPELLRKYFSEPNNDPVSVYEVEDQHDEIRVAAAIGQNAGHSHIEDANCLRIRHEDFQNAGLKLTPDGNGRTGVKSVDTRHCSVIGDDNSFTQLISILARAIREGQDRVRYFGNSQFHYQYEEFERLPDDQISAGARGNSSKALTKSRN